MRLIGAWKYNRRWTTSGHGRRDARNRDGALLLRRASLADELGIRRRVPEADRESSKLHGSQWARRYERSSTQPWRGQRIRSADALLSAMKGRSWEASCGPMSIEYHDWRRGAITSTGRKVERANGEFNNVEFVTFEAVEGRVGLREITPFATIHAAALEPSGGFGEDRTIE